MNPQILTKIFAKVQVDSPNGFSQLLTKFYPWGNELVQGQGGMGCDGFVLNSGKPDCSDTPHALDRTIF